MKENKDFKERKQAAAFDLFEIQRAYEVKPLTLNGIKRKMFYDVENKSFRLIGKAHDYTSGK